MSEYTVYWNTDMLQVLVWTLWITMISSFEVTAVNVVVPTLEEKYNYNFGFHDYKVTNFMSQNIW